jgi:hypothetical protein
MYITSWLQTLTGKFSKSGTLGVEDKSYSYRFTDLDRSLGLQEVGARHMKVARFLALRTGRLYSSGDIPLVLIAVGG